MTVNPLMRNVSKLRYYVLVTNDKGYYQGALMKSVNTLVNILPQFDCAYWSMYDLDGKITSPFYHNLHIAQMKVMYDLTGKEIFKEYANRWQKQQRNVFCKSLAFLIKAIQKIKE